MHKNLLKKTLIFGIFSIIAIIFIITLSTSTKANYEYPPRSYFGFSYAEDDFFTWEYYKYGPNYYMHTGFDYDNDDEKWRGWTEWDISSIPDDAEIFDVGVQFEVTGKPTECDTQWADVDIYHIENRPSITGADIIEDEDEGGPAELLWNDAGDGSIYVNYYSMNSNGYYPSSSTYLDLGLIADFDLKQRLISDWFAIGVADTDDDYDEGIIFRVSSFRIEYSRYPEGSSSDIISYPSNIYPGIECTVVADYHDPDGYDDIHYCWLRIDNDASYPVEEYLDLRWEDGGLTWIDPTDSEYVSINSVIESSSDTTTTLTWNFVLDWDWTEDISIDFGVKTEDDHGLSDGWETKEANIRYENDVFLNDLTINCSSDWNGGYVEDDDWIGAEDNVIVSGHFYYEDSNVAPPSDVIIADLYADYNYTGVSDLCDANGYFNGIFLSGNETDLDYLIDAIASNIPEGGNESTSADDGKSTKIDAMIPTTPNPDDGIDGWSNNNTPNFTWDSIDNHSGINGYYWKVDGGEENWIDISSITLPEQIDGEHIFSVKAEDKVGNIGYYGQHSFYIDTTSPHTMYTLDGELQGDVYVGQVAVFLNGTDEMSGVQFTKYKIDENSWNLYSQPFVITESGHHTVYFYSVDNADNSEDQKECTFIVGNTPNDPEIHGPSSGKAGTEYDYTFISNDIDGDDIYYFIEWGDGEYEEWIGPYESDEEITVNHIWSEEGDYTIKAKAKDTFDLESEWTILEITMPVNKQNSYSFIGWFFNRFSNPFHWY